MPRSGVNRDEAFGARLREAMERKGLRPADLARALGVHPVTVARWRRGECPDKFRLPALAECIGVDVTRLKTGEAGRSEGEAAPVSPDTPEGRLRALTRRLAFLRDAIHAYTTAGRVPPAEVLRDWERAAADVLEDTGRITPPEGYPAARKP